MKITKFISAAPAAVALIPSNFNDKTSDLSTLRFKNDFEQFSDSEFLIESKNVTQGYASTVVISVITEEWNKDLSDRFDHLAIKHSLSEITPDEEIELDNLQSLRIRELSPRSYQEVIREFEIEKAAQNAIDAINELSRTVSSHWPSAAKEKKA